jgi:hypothetical protein
MAARHLTVTETVIALLTAPGATYHDRIQHLIKTDVIGLDQGMTELAVAENRSGELTTLDAWFAEQKS